MNDNVLKSLLLPVGLPLFYLIAWFIPEVGEWLKKHGFVFIFTFLIFIQNGYNLRLSASHIGKSFLPAFLMGIAVSLILTPLVVSKLIGHLPLEPTLLLGVLVMSAVPPTHSSGIVLSATARGSAAWAILLTIGLNFVSAFTLPFVLPTVLSSTSGVNIPASAILWKLCLLVLLPVLLGMFLKKKIRRELPYWMSFLPPFFILMILFTFVGSSKEILKTLPLNELPLLIAITGGIHVSLFFTNFGLGKVLKLSEPFLKSFVLVSSQKTLPLSMTVLALLFDQTGLAIIACVVFHFFQLIFDSIVASWVGAKGE